MPNSAGVEHYFASADYQTLYRQFGIRALPPPHETASTTPRTALGEEAIPPPLPGRGGGTADRPA